ncbi:chromosome segregation protein SMC [Lactococcus nasutitermitis]|uniref:Chromosome partition protein Smc n=1 Tax=Lactococcus nasutitermitis TaxID=1652957 RepID=A0ABV9JEB8_9LACT|nr:chromosome segregation protein SMC [Lactococcus nasutitermitis]
MYLKKMEIVGFKSFADRTKIAFDQGITAVVGPNGSGKSNIVEALRWVLGEQSAKALRGGKMPDVIFSGTEKRRALNYAEVIATFDNQDNYLLGHDDDDEVVICRRLYRTGDSEFLLNGHKCRLRDIHDLFTDTGLGRDSLSIISQGRIESVFNSKAEERRAIFEEAAGVLKYKNRKSETESKLRGTQDNLDRLEDIIFELNGQLVPLQAQRDVALRFRELDGRREKLALSVLVGQLISEKEKYEQTKISLLEVLESLTELSKRQETYDAELTGLRTRRGVVEDEQEKLRAESLALTELKAELTRKIERFDLQKSSSEKSETERLERVSELNQKLSDLEKSLAEAEKNLTELSKEKLTVDDEIERLTAVLTDLSESPEVAMERLREEFVRLVAEEAELSNQMVRNKSEAENLTRQLAERDENSRERSEKLTTVSQELAEAEAELAELEAEIYKLLAEFDKKTQEEKNLAVQEKTAQDTMYAQMNELSTKKARLSSLENIRDNHSNLYQGVRSVMQHQAELGGIIGVMADLLTFDTKYTVAMDIALGGGSQNIVTEDENAAKGAIAYLRQNRLGRATFLPLTTIKAREFNAYQRLQSMTGFVNLAINLVNFDKRLYNAVSSLLGSTVIVDSADHATAIAREMRYSVRIVTLDGTQINPGGSYAGGAGKRNTTTFTSAEIEALTGQIAQAESQLKSAEQAVQKAQNARKLLTDDLSNLRELGEDRRFAQKTVALKVEQLSEEKNNLTELSKISAGSENAEILIELTNSNEKITVQLATIAQRKIEIDQQLDSIKSDSQAQNELKVTKQNQLTQAKLRLSEITSALRFGNQEKTRQQEEFAQLTTEKSRLDIFDSSVKFDEATRTSLSEQLTQATDKLQAVNVQLVSLKFEREDLTAQMEDFEQHNHEFIAQNQDLNTQKTRLEMQIEQSEKLLHDKQNQLASDYNMSFEEAKNQANIAQEADENITDGQISLADLSEAEQQLKQLERQIRALGAVNLDAIEQFDEVNTRFEFLTSQKEDLTEAKNLLLATMDDMNDEIKIRFKSTFEAIRVSFQTTFSQMFVGGHADLELTSDNLLEAGVEINVQPPGKKLASLNLMSGGEKALTALALIFAILRVRTVPFVVLDEVEAALDEANVKRFGDYMNHFDNSNQFIVVTHRRGTMAAAGTMYGVTMADAGVSKILSVKLEEA